MGAFSNIDIMLQSIKESAKEPIKVGSVGVRLDDERQPPELCRVTTIFEHGYLEMQVLSDGRRVYCDSPDFWPLI